MRSLFIYILIPFFTLNSLAQNNVAVTDLKFDTNYYDALDKWVVFPKQATDSIYKAGFIYLDLKEGITFQPELYFYIDNQGKWNVSKRKDQIIKKQLLEQNTPKVALLNLQKRKEFLLPITPLWFKNYKNPKSVSTNLIKTGTAF